MSEMCNRQVGVSVCSLEEEDEADHEEQQNDQNLQEEGSQNSVLIIGVGVRVRPGLQPQLRSLSLLPEFAVHANVDLMAVRLCSKVQQQWWATLAVHVTSKMSSLGMV